MPSSINETESHNPKPNFSMRKRVIYLLAEAILFIALLFYFVLQKEGIDFGFIPLLLIAGGLIFFHHKNFLRKKKKYHSFRLGAEEIENISQTNRDGNSAKEQALDLSHEKNISQTEQIYQSSTDSYVVSFWRKHKRIISLLIFCVIVLSIIWLLLGYDYNFSTTQSNFERKKECQELGNYVYQDFKTRYGTDNVDTPEYVYNHKLDTCITYLKYYIPNLEMLREVVIDSLTRKELASYIWYSDIDKEKAKQKEEVFNNAKSIYFSEDILGKD